jgi:hypothetical protein
MLLGGLLAGKGQQQLCAAVAVLLLDRLQR